jgi:hypothetical protein
VDLGVSNHFSIGGGSNAPAVFARNQFQYADDIDLIRGRHHFTLGAEFMAIQMDEVNISLGNGEWTFNGSLAGDALADFMIGRPSLLANGNPLQIGLRQKYWGAYFQDDIRVSKTFNMHIGLRWEPSLPEHDVAGRGAHFSLPAFQAGQVSIVYPNAPAGLLFHGDPGIPAAYANSNYLGFAPRFGLAWDPSGKGEQSLRASFGIFCDSPESYTNRDWELAAPWGARFLSPLPPAASPIRAPGYPGGNPFPPPIRLRRIRRSHFRPVCGPAAGAASCIPKLNLSYQRQLGGKAGWFRRLTSGTAPSTCAPRSEQNPAIFIPGCIHCRQPARALCRLC